MNNYDFSQVEDGDDYALPEGQYLAKVVESVWESSKKNPNNKFIKLTLVINNRNVFEYLNLKNDNEVAQNIGMKRCKQYLAALNRGMNFPSDSALSNALLGTVEVELGIKTSEFGRQNIVKKVLASKSAPGKDFDADSIPF